MAHMRLSLKLAPWLSRPDGIRVKVGYTSAT